MSTKRQSTEMLLTAEIKAAGTAERPQSEIAPGTPTVGRRTPGRAQRYF